MAGIWGSFRDCGSTSYVILMLTIVALADAVVAAIVVFGSKRRPLAIMLSAIAACLGVGILGVGELAKDIGTVSVQEQTEPHIVPAPFASSDPIDPYEAQSIRDKARRESAQCAPVGLAGSALPLIFGLILLPIALLKKK
jgi:hypothetical protein